MKEPNLVSHASNVSDAAGEADFLHHRSKHTHGQESKRGSCRMRMERVGMEVIAGPAAVPSQQGKTTDLQPQDKLELAMH